MRVRRAIGLLCICWAAGGCAHPILQRPGATPLFRVERDGTLKVTRPAAPPATDHDEPAAIEAAPTRDEEVSVEYIQRSGRPKYSLIVQGREFVPAPQPSSPRPPRGSRSGTLPGAIEAEVDLFNRPLADVPLDVAPPEGAMPTELAGIQAEGLLDGPREQSAQRPNMLCSWSPWTICYRPLYFEEVELERYGCSCGCLAQSGVSAFHFLSSVALLPYQMTVHPPRSCVCSNGFSRCGDPKPPGYGACVLRADAALVQTGVVCGIIAILP